MEEAKENQLETNVLQREAGQENGTVASALLVIKGKLASKFVQSWVGTIQWIGQSSFRKMHKRKNWFIGVFEVESLQLKTLSEKDIQYQAM